MRPAELAASKPFQARCSTCRLVLPTQCAPGGACSRAGQARPMLACLLQSALGGGGLSRGWTKCREAVCQHVARASPGLATWCSWYAWHARRKHRVGAYHPSNTEGADGVLWSPKPLNHGICLSKVLSALSERCTGTRTRSTVGKHPCGLHRVFGQFTLLWAIINRFSRRACPCRREGLA